MKKITSINNQEIKNITKLRKASERKKQGLFVIEGRHEIFLAKKAGVKIEVLYFCSSFNSDENFLIDFQDAINLTEEVFRKISLREQPDGCLAVARVEDKKLDDVKLKKEALILVLESLEKPGNIGAILRTADAVRVDAVFLCNAKTDIHNSNVIRASLGTVFTNNVIVCSLEEAGDWFKKNKFKVYALDPSAKTSYCNEKYSSFSAIFVGTEHAGLSEKALKLADKKISIPMRGKIDSLNASVSVAVALYEVIRQKRQEL